MIQAINLTKKYGKLTAVDDLNLEIPAGEIFGLLGPNGAGKTTTLMMLSTLLQPTSGKAFVNGFDVVKNPLQVRESIGMVFQDPSSDTTLNAYENLKLHALLYDLPLRNIDRKIDEVLNLVNLQERKKDRVKNYSGGMRRRLEIARGLMHEPKIFFLDEPTLGLDPQTRKHIWDYINDLAKKIGMTIIVTTHYMEEAQNLCRRIAIIDHGKIAVLDTPDNLIRDLGGDCVTLQGSVDVQALSGLTYVSGITQFGAGWQMSVADAGKHLPELLKVAGDINNVEVHSPDLNDVFLRYTGRTMRDKADDGEESFLDAARAFSGNNH